MNDEKLEKLVADLDSYLPAAAVQNQALLKAFHAKITEVLDLGWEKHALSGEITYVAEFRRPREAGGFGPWTLWSRGSVDDADLMRGEYLAMAPGSARSGQVRLVKRITGVRDEILLANYPDADRGD